MLAVSKTFYFRVAILVAISILPVSKFLPSATAQQTDVASPEWSPILSLLTDNNSTVIEIKWSPENMQPNERITFDLVFKRPPLNTQIDHVNYNFQLLDEDDKVVVTVPNLHTNSGHDTVPVTLEKVGNYKVKIQFLGTGLNPPFSTIRSGNAEASIVVTPEFPLAPAVLATATALIVVLSIRQKLSIR